MMLYRGMHVTFCQSCSILIGNVKPATHGQHLQVGWLEFNVPFQHKYGYIRYKQQQPTLCLWRPILTADSVRSSDTLDNVVDHQRRPSKMAADCVTDTDVSVGPCDADLTIERYAQEVVHCESKKQGTTILSITSPNVDRFSNFFHWQIR